MEIKLTKLTLAAFLPIILPPATLLSWLGIAMVLDLFTGVAAAIVKGIPRTSSGLRGTVKKFVQYGSAIAVGIVLANVADISQDQNTKNIYQYFSNGLLIFIIYIEIKSILENAIEISPASDFTKFFLTPVHNALSLNFLNKYTNQTPKNP